MRRRRLPTTLNRSTVPMIALFVASAHISFKGKHVLANKGKYGLKAMVHLAGLEPGAIAPSHRNRRNEFDLEKIPRSHPNRAAACRVCLFQEG